MTLERTRLLLLLVLPGLTSCASAAFPHIGTVDTRLHPAGTVHAQASAGGGVALVMPDLGGSVAADTFLSPRLSLATSAHILGSPEELIMPGARLGLRFRVSPRFSLGAGASVTTGLEILDSENPRQRLATGFDLELATSRVLSRGRFESHAWRLAYAQVPGVEKSPSFVGDWSRSRPTSNPRLRFSYGINYGVTVWTPDESQGAAAKSPAEVLDASRQVGYASGPVQGPLPFLGFHLGMQFGSPRMVSGE